MQKLKFYGHLLRLNLKSSVASGFWLQMLFMVLNNGIFWIIWLIFFRTFDQINGWRLPQVTLMYATAQFAWGIKVVVFGGTRNLARVISDGEFDGFLLQPRNPLLHIATTRSFASGWGDILSGLALVGISGLVGHIGPALLYAFALGCAVITFTAAEVILHCMAFWLGPTNTLSRQLTEYIIMLSCYPQNIYHGWLKAAMYFLLPAAVIGLLPVELVQGSASAGFALAGLTTFFAATAGITFHRGIKRYIGA